MPAEDTIGQWTPTVLVKFIRDLFAQQPPNFLPNLKAEQVQVTQKLNVVKDLVYSKEPAFRQVGQTGQPGFLNSWVNFASGWQVAGFHREPLGWITLRGLIKSGTPGSTSVAFVLPPGFRPPLAETFSTISSTGVARIDVEADGDVIVQSGSTTWTSLGGIRFRTS